MKNVLFKSKIRNAKMKILQVASALTICLGGIFGSTLPVAANTVGTNVYVYCKNQTSAGSFTISGNLNVDVANRSGTKGGYRVHGTVSVSSSSNGSWWGKGIYLKNGNNSLLGSKIFKDTGSVAVDFSTSTWNWGTGATSETLYLIVGAANSNKTAMNYSITNNGNNQNVSATTSGGNTYNGYAYAVKMSIPATAATLSYNANGGSVSPGSKTCSIGGTYGTLPTPTRTGYSFSGWYTSASGGNKCQAAQKWVAAIQLSMHIGLPTHIQLAIMEMVLIEARRQAVNTLMIVQKIYLLMGMKKMVMHSLDGVQVQMEVYNMVIKQVL